MTLRELEARFQRRGYQVGRWREVDSISEAEGVQFLCPVCFEQNDGPVGTHSIMCWAPMVGQEWTPGPGRWDLVGTSLDDLSLVAGSSSVKLPDGDGACGAHFFVKNGRISRGAMA